MKSQKLKLAMGNHDMVTVYMRYCCCYFHLFLPFQSKMLKVKSLAPEEDQQKDHTR